MVKILLVEDDQDQLSWAKKQLSGHELIMVEEIYAARKALKTGVFDFVVTDLVLPRFWPSNELGESRTEPPHPKNGEAVWREALRLYAQGKVGGVALVSNYEHHINRAGEGIAGSGWYSDRYEAAGELGIRVKDFYEPLEFIRHSRSTNTIVFVDGLVLSRYEAVMYGTEILLSPGKEWFGRYDLDRKKIKLLKPYRAIVEALMEGFETG